MTDETGMPNGWRAIGASWYKMGEDITLASGNTLPGATAAWTMPSTDGDHWVLFAYGTKDGKKGTYEIGRYETAATTAVVWELNSNG